MMPWYTVTPENSNQERFQLLQGCHRSANGQEKKFFKVRGKSGNFILSKGKLTF